MDHLLDGRTVSTVPRNQNTSERVTESGVNDVVFNKKYCRITKGNFNKPSMQMAINFQDSFVKY